MTDEEYELRERECIMEYDGGMAREQAEKAARASLSKEKHETPHPSPSSLQHPERR